MPISISSSIEYCKEGRIDYTWLAGVHGCHFLELIQEIHLLAPRAVLQQQLVFIFEDVAFDEGPLGDVLGVALRRRNLQNKMEPPVNHRIKKNQIPLDSFWDSFRVLRALSGGFFLLFFFPRFFQSFLYPFRCWKGRSSSGSSYIIFHVSLFFPVLKQCSELERIRSDFRWSSATPKDSRPLSGKSLSPPLPPNPQTVGYSFSGTVKD